MNMTVKREEFASDTEFFLSLSNPGAFVTICQECSKYIMQDGREFCSTKCAKDYEDFWCKTCGEHPDDCGH